jgi:hypothetical protein
MSISYQWCIKKLECVPLLEGNRNVVCSISWELHGVNERNVSSFVYSNQEIAYEQNASFVNFNNLTKKQVEDWVIAAIGEIHVNAYKQIVAEKIDAIENPKVISPALPWEQIPA